MVASMESQRRFKAVVLNLAADKLQVFIAIYNLALSGVVITLRVAAVNNATADACCYSKIFPTKRR